MPKKVDHEARRRQITDAVCAITLRGGLRAATFRQIAAEAGISVRLVQYYFGTKEALLHATQEHVAERSTERIMAWVMATDGSPRAVLEAFLGSFAPVDEETRVAILMYIALYTESVISGGEDIAARVTEGEMMETTIREQLERGTLRDGVDVKQEARSLTTLMPGLGQYVLAGMYTAQEALDVISYRLDHIFKP